jgi:N6-adenosine-specific RNA methylase IME4
MQIHQDLPYGTMEDDEMRRMNIGCLQDDGVIFLWVTGERVRDHVMPGVNLGCQGVTSSCVTP